MQVDLFSSAHLRKQVNRRISYIRNTQYTISNNITKDSLLKYCLEFTNYDTDFMKAIDYSLENPRNCFNVLGTEVDSHFNLETLNVSSRGRDFVVVYSIQYLLPLILNMLCGVDPIIFKDNEKAKSLSKAILEVDFKGDCKLSCIMGIDENLDKFIDRYISGSSNEVEALSCIVHEVNSVAMEILKYIVGYLESYSPMVVLCIDRSKVLLSSNLEEVEPIELDYEGIRYVLNPFITNETFGYYKHGESHSYLTDFYRLAEEGEQAL